MEQIYQLRKSILRFLFFPIQPIVTLIYLVRIAIANGNTSVFRLNMVWLREKHIATAVKEKLCVQFQSCHSNNKWSIPLLTLWYMLGSHRCRSGSFRWCLCGNRSVSNVKNAVPEWRRNYFISPKVRLSYWLFGCYMINNNFLSILHMKIYCVFAL